MIDLRWYLLVVVVSMLLASIWSTWHNTEHQPGKTRLHKFAGTFVNCAISSLAYWILVFILSLTIAAAIWLGLLLLIWVPSDFFQNYFGADVFSRALTNIKPAIFKSASSPGLTGIPLMDYLSLASAYLLGPWLGIWSILKTDVRTINSNIQTQN